MAGDWIPAKAALSLLLPDVSRMMKRIATPEPDRHQAGC